MLRLFQRDAPRPSEAAFIEVSHAGETYCIHLRRTAAARRFTLRVRTAARDVVLTIPARGSLSEAKSFAARHAAWIGAKLRRVPEAMRFEPGESVPLRGVPHRIAHRPGLRGIVSVEMPLRAEGAEPLLWVSGDPAFAHRRVQDFLMREAKRDIEAAVARHAARLGVKIRKITLRDTTSRWGSCSASGALNFSWRLIMAPHFVLDYLAAHEVSHLEHMNHSDAFWSVVGRLSPDVADAEAWLKAHGSGLLRFGRGKIGASADV
ncbi:MAG: SprT family zinc-dependent metalloprotease [Methylocella sp.]